jgi:hypothetical protein
MAALFHAAMNTAWAVLNVMWGDLRLFWLCAAFTVALAVAVAVRQAREDLATPVCCLAPRRPTQLSGPDQGCPCSASWRWWLCIGLVGRPARAGTRGRRVT